MLISDNLIDTTELETTTDSLTLLQLSDLHLYQNVNGGLLGVNCQQTFEATLQHALNFCANPDLLILTGDLAQEPKPAVYQKIYHRLEQTGVCYACIAGNHDVTDKNTAGKHIAVTPINKHLANKKRIVSKHWQLLFINSGNPGQVNGHIDQATLTWLQQHLTDCKRSTVIIMHHQPIPVGSAWLDKLGINNQAEFWQTVSDYPHLKLVLFGHVHQAFSGCYAHVQVLSSPSTCVQFKPKSDGFAIDNLPPGYRWLTLHADGTFTTDVNRLPTMPKVNTQATGY